MTESGDIVQSTSLISSASFAEATQSIADSAVPPLLRDVDFQIVEALKQGNRTYVLMLGQLLESLINDEKSTRTMLLPSTYDQRWLVHQCCAYYRLKSEVDPLTEMIYVESTPESRIICSMLELLELVPAVHSPSGLEDRVESNLGRMISLWSKKSLLNTKAQLGAESLESDEYHTHHRQTTSLKAPETTTDFRRLEAEIQNDSSSRDSDACFRNQLKEFKHLYLLDKSWPPNDLVSLLSYVAQNSPDLASLAVRFLRDPFISDPQFQLDHLLEIFENAIDGNAQELPHLYDSLCLDILSRIPSNTYDNVKRILILQVLSPDPPSLAMTCTNLNIAQGDAYKGLRYLHPVLSIPSSQDSSHKNITKRDDSFLAFLTDSTRSGKYAIVEKDNTYPVKDSELLDDTQSDLSAAASGTAPASESISGVAALEPVVGYDVGSKDALVSPSSCQVSLPDPPSYETAMSLGPKTDDMYEAHQMSPTISVGTSSATSIATIQRDSIIDPPSGTPKFHQTSLTGVKSSKIDTKAVPRPLRSPWLRDFRAPSMLQILSSNTKYDPTVRNAHLANETETEKIQMEMTLERLVQVGQPSAMLKSKERSFTPRCNGDTRQSPRRRFIEWVQNDVENRHLFWLSGPIAVGKSAIAQSVAEELEQQGLLGAVFFFSRFNNRSDPNVVIPTLAYQLASLLPEYRQIITQRLIADPLILRRARRSQFEELIIEPFHALMSHKPLVIVIDGMDECQDREAQCEFVDMIAQSLRTEAGLRLRWIICSRPEPHLTLAFSMPDCKAVCLEEKLEIDDSEAQEDVRRILQDGFAEIREKYPYRVIADWPAEHRIRFIAERTSGHLGFASFIIQFVGDHKYGDPSGQLYTCIRYLERTSSSVELNILQALDSYYTRMLSNIPNDLLSTTRRILGLIICDDIKHLTADAHLSFLALEQESFYRSLEHLHPVLRFATDQAGLEHIQIYHVSFFDYLQDPTRSGKFWLEVPYLDIALSGLRWLANRPKQENRPVIDRDRQHWGMYLFGFPHEKLYSFSFMICWKICPQVPENSLEQLVNALEVFDFNLDYQRWLEKTGDFANFIRWLASLGAHNTSLVVVERWTQERPTPSQKKGTLILHHWEDDPYAFVASFLEGATRADSYTIELRLGILKPAPICLCVGTSLLA